MKNPFPKDQLDEFEPFIYLIIRKKLLTKKIPEIKKDFLDVILSRKSSKELSPITDIDLSYLLYYSNKIHEFQQDESKYWISKRTAPSAGARHPIDLLISPSNSLNNRTLEYYNPIDHSLNLLNIKEDLLKDFFNEININVEIKEACIIWFSIQVGKTSSKYYNAESLYWRDAGVLLYCVQIVATYLGLKSCPLGTLAANSYFKLFKADGMLPAGGILVGK